MIKPYVKPLHLFHMRRLWVLGPIVLVALLMLVGVGLALGEAALVNSDITQTEFRSSAATQTLTVCPTGPPDCGFSSIQTAIDVADEGALIKVAAGVYADLHQVAAPPGYPHWPSSGVITQVVFLSKTLTIRGGYRVGDWEETPELAYNSTVLDANGRGRGLCVTGAISPVVTGLTIRRGDAQGLGGGSWSLQDTGGGVYVLTAAVTISGNWVVSNVAAFGGGLFLVESTALISDNVILSNTADLYSDGGGVYVSGGAVQLESNVVQANRAGHNGGGILVNGGDTMLAGNYVVGNHALFGGGLFLWFSDPWLNGNRFHDNVAERMGGGVFFWHSRATLLNNFVTDNRAYKSGSGMYVNISEPQLIQNIIARNAGGDGAGVVVRSGTPGQHSHLYMTDTIVVSCRPPRHRRKRLAA